MIQTESDVIADVDAVFDELECCSNKGTPHEGDKAAFAVWHGCNEGFLCAAHYQDWLTGSHRIRMVKIALAGFIICTRCGRAFTNIDAFEKAYPL